MASRGGRGGGRGGRGGASNKPQMPTGHLMYADIIAQSKEGTDVLYPPAEMPDTDFPSEREARIASRYNTMTSEMKFTPFWIDAPQKASTDIERYSDRFKMGRASADGTLTATLASLHESRKLDKGLLPNAAFEAVFEKKKRTRVGGEGRTRRQKIKIADALAGDDENAGDKDENSGSELDEEAEYLDDEEDEEGGDDYEDNYFDNGEGDEGDGDAGGGDDEGGTF